MLEREDSREEGREEGYEEGREMGIKEGREEGYEEGREEGKVEGREEGRLEGSILTLYKLGYTVPIIAERLAQDEERVKLVLQKAGENVIN